MLLLEFPLLLAHDHHPGQQAREQMIPPTASQLRAERERLQKEADERGTPRIEKALDDGAAGDEQGVCRNPKHDKCRDEDGMCLICFMGWEDRT